MLRLASLALLALAATGCATRPVDIVPAARPADDKRVDLSRHKTDAILIGIERQPCRHLTAECPDRCGHGGRFARFSIESYREYEKLDTYGDPRANEFQVQLEDGRGKATIPAALLTQINALKPGDHVWLDWTHEYVTRDGSSWPERTVTRLEPAGH